METARQKLNEYIKSQLTDHLVEIAIEKVDRKEFIPSDQKDYAYMDVPLPIGCSQTISQPSLVAWMTEQLELKENDTILEVGTGSGYQAALLAELAKEVVTIERIPELSQRAERILTKLGYTNVTAMTGDGSKGYPAKAPYDAVIVTAAGQNIPQLLIDQLAEGGRLIIPIGGPIAQEIIKGIKREGKLTTQRLLPVRFVPLIEE